MLGGVAETTSVGSWVSAARSENPSTGHLSQGYVGSGQVVACVLAANIIEKCCVAMFSAATRLCKVRGCIDNIAATVVMVADAVPSVSWLATRARGAIARGL